MTARDELAELLADTIPQFHEYADAFGEIADAILAAGYSKPRTITTAEELDALPNGATLKTLIGGKPVGRVWGKVEGEWWGLAIHGTDYPVLPAALIHKGYPA